MAMGEDTGQGDATPGRGRHIDAPWRLQGMWLKERRSALRLTLAEAAAMIGTVSAKALGSAELGLREITLHKRDGVEVAYMWEEGALTRAYDLGERPRVRKPTGDDLLSMIQQAPPEDRAFLIALYNRQRDELLERLRAAHGLPVNSAATFGTRRRSKSA